MKYIPVLLCIIYVNTAFGQDIIITNDEDVVIHPIQHASMVLTYGDNIIYMDPYGGAEKYSSFGAPTHVYITDIHGDHLHPATLEALDLSRAKLIVPQAVYDALKEPYKSKCEIISNGETKQIGGIEVTAVPMYNFPEDNRRHPKGRGNGYVLNLGGKQFYISGDTEDIPEMRNLDNIDVAFVCMNLPYTMDVEAAADAVNEFKPAIVYPFHYRGPDGLSDIEKFKELVTAVDVEVRLRDWYK